jgi:hypothetical protein
VHIRAHPLWRFSAVDTLHEQAVESNSCLVWGSATSDLWNEVASATLPCASDLWQAPDEHSWAALLPSTRAPPQIRFHELFRRSCDPATRLETHLEFKNQ